MTFSENKVQDIEFIMEPANRSLDLRCATPLILPLSYTPSLFLSLSPGQRDPPRASRIPRHKKVWFAFFPQRECHA